MKICAIPSDIRYASPADNLVSMAHALSQVEQDTDVVVIPELFTTSFIPDHPTLKALAETNDGKTVESLRRWAAFFGFAIAGSFLATDGNNRYYNRAFFVEPMGDITFYDKRHLFPLSTENKVYTPGTEMAPQIRFRGWEFKLIVCFDLRFPVWTRNIPGHLYDVLLVPSNWPHARREQFRLLLAARGVENQIYTVGCNRTGSDDFGTYPPGDSAIFDNFGNPIHETRRNGYLYTLLDRRALDQGRSRFPAFEAADSFTINI